MRTALHPLDFTLMAWANTSPRDRNSSAENDASRRGHDQSMGTENSSRKPWDTPSPFKPTEVVSVGTQLA